MSGAYQYVGHASNRENVRMRVEICVIVYFLANFSSVFTIIRVQLLAISTGPANNHIRYLPDPCAKGAPQLQPCVVLLSKQL